MYICHCFEKQTNKTKLESSEMLMMMIMLQSVVVCTFHTSLGWPKRILTRLPQTHKRSFERKNKDPSSKQQRKEQQQHQEQCRHSEKKRGLMRREREDGSCCHLLTSSLEKTAKRRAHTSKKPK
jgi:hypothetical protein